jgi:hypothetical protein
MPMAIKWCSPAAFYSFISAAQAFLRPGKVKSAVPVAILSARVGSSARPQQTAPAGKEMPAQFGPGDVSSEELSRKQLQVMTEKNSFAQPILSSNTVSEDDRSNE